MRKPVFGLMLGGVLGIFDGLSALISAPEVAPQILTIVIGSNGKSGRIDPSTVGPKPCCEYTPFWRDCESCRPSTALKAASSR